MARKSLTATTEEKVLTKCRRRCAICFGLNRDTHLKSGQIAHLDKDNQNHSEINLCFLCLEHHDEYDSRTSQRKGFTKKEVISYRRELHEAVGKSFAIEVHFGEINPPSRDPYAGNYIRINAGSDSAQIELTPVPDSVENFPRYFASGTALAGNYRDHGPNIGDLSLVVTMDEADELSGLGDVSHDDDIHEVRLSFEDGKMTVTEENYRGVYGAGVTFQGVYHKV